eukprot:CAMPEP_0118634660 /NCGR_PEP_ID=MMETSP0785-20121206/1667_1 /TAXON_ID=91992 /ORGANISM="Bolidomonas pacifica, Strain CCMP 1866" /LENGTH=3685 /DNA_ID=CAMNT_0006525653 /DNA_START=427 /DNA_END=11481 /DNA_ORIENTATION=+
MVKCPDITEPFIMWNMLMRFLSDEIYTSIGDILICVNPFKTIKGLYDNDRIIRVKEQPDLQALSESPHVYNMANSALNGLTYKNRTQSIVISGESGAGKTEQTKKCLQFYSHSSSVPLPYSKPRSASIPESDSISSRILSANPILEAFGNAKTVRNNNSSRFGKWMKIRFRRVSSEEVVMVGCHTDHYLLEKARLVSHSPNERSFHIFYQLLSGGLTSDLLTKAELDGKSANYFYYLSFGDTTIDSVDDEDELKTTMEAFKAIGFETDEIESLLISLAGILYLGNVDFVETESDGTMAGDSSTPDLNSCASLLGVNPDRLDRAVTTKERNVRGESIISPLTGEQSTASRDALAKATYSAIFDWIMNKVNDSMRIPERNTMTPFIGILDIFGFEIFEENSFEQLCINYCNEKLQKHFVEQIIKKEEAMCRQENLNYTPSQIVDNTDVLELIEEHRAGLLPMLDEECKINKGTDMGFLSKVTKTFKDNNRFKVDVHFEKSEFMIHHYAGSVKYETTGWMERNKDELAAHLEEMMAACQNSFLKSLFVEKLNKRAKLEKASGPGHKISQVTESGEFIKQLNSLSDALESSMPHFIRCIKPNSQKEPSLIEPQLVVEQLRYSGVLEAVKIRKQGFPFRPTHKEFWKRYWPVVPNFEATIKNEDSQDDDERCLTLLTLLQNLEVEEGKETLFQMVEYGLTRIFYRTEQHEFLESLRRRKRSYFAVLIQKFHRGRVGRKRHKMLSALRHTMYYFVGEFSKRTLFKSSEVDTLANTLSAASCNNLECDPSKEASRILLILKQRDNIRRGAKEKLKMLPTCTEDTTSVLTSIKEDLQYAIENDMEGDEFVKELLGEAEKLEKYSNVQLELEECTVAFDKERINTALDNVRALEEGLGHYFCNIAKERAIETLKEIADEEEKLQKLVDMIIHPDASLFSPDATLPLSQDHVEKIKANLAPLEQEISSWESSMPRSVSGVSLIESARLTFDMRTAIIEDSLLTDEKEFLENSKEEGVVGLLPTKFDAYIDKLSPKEFKIDPCVENELKFIKINLAKQKYLPTIKEMLKMPIPPGPVGEIDVDKVPIDVLDNITTEAKSQEYLQDDSSSKRIINQATVVLKIRKHWKSSEWEPLFSCTSKTSLPKHVDLIQEEIYWARLEARDNIFQKELKDLMKEGAMEKGSKVPIVKFSHIEDFLKELQGEVASPSKSLGIFRAKTSGNVEMLPKTESTAEFSHSVASLEAIDTALLTIELRKLQDAAEWGAVLTLFREADVSTTDLEKIQPSKTRRRRSLEISGAIGKAGETLRSSISSVFSDYPDPDTPKVVSRYPRAYLTDEMENAKADASHRIVKQVLIPAMSEGGVVGVVGQVDTSHISCSKLEPAIKQANELPLDVEGETKDLIEDARLLLEFRKVLKKHKNDPFGKSFGELEKLADKRKMPKTPTAGAAPSFFRAKSSGNIELSPMGEAGSPKVGSAVGPRPGEEELDLLVGEVRYIQVKQDIPQILKAGGATNEPGKTDFSSIDFQGLVFTIDAIQALPQVAREMEDLQMLTAAVEAIKNVRKALQDADDADEADKPRKWENAANIVEKVLESHVAYNLPKTCKDTVEKEIKHASDECKHQVIEHMAKRALTSGKLSGDINDTSLDEIDTAELEKTLSYVNKVGYQTAANKDSIENCQLALKLRTLQKKDDPASRDELKAFLNSDLTLASKAQLFQPLVNEIEFAKDLAYNKDAVDRIEGEIIKGKIDRWTPGVLKMQHPSVHVGLREAIIDARHLKRQIAPRTKVMIEAGSIISSIRQLISDRENYGEIKNLVAQYMSKSDIYAKGFQSKTLHNLNSEVSLADCHVKVIELADRLYQEALMNKVAIQTHLEKVGEPKEFGSLKNTVEDLDMSMVNVDVMARAVSDSLDLLKVTGKDHKMPAAFFRELVDVCDSICTLRENLKEGNYAGVKKALFDQVKNQKFVDKKEVDKRSPEKVDLVEEEHRRLRHELYIVYNQERIIARQENNDYQIRQLFQRAFATGKVSGEVGNVDYSNLSTTELQHCIQQVAQLRPRTPNSIELHKIAGVLLKIRNALKQEPRDWNLVKSELDQLNKVIKGKLDDYDAAKDEISLVKNELDNVRIVNILSTALSKGWDKNSAIGDLKKGRIDSEGLALAIRQVADMAGSGQSKDAKELTTVASLMKEIRANLRHCLDIGGDAMRQQEESEAWLLVGENIEKMELLQKENPNGKGVKVTKMELARVQKELNLYDASQGIVYALFQGSEAHVQKEIEKNVANIEPHIHTLEAAIKDAVKAKLDNPKLTILLKNANSILKIRKSLLKAHWNDVENECITFSLSQNINEHAKIEIDLSISEAHNQLVYLSLERCLHDGGASGEIGNLNFKDIKVNSFQRAFEIVEEKKESSYELRPQVKNLLSWAKLIYELRTAQRVSNPDSRSSKLVIDAIIDKMIAEKDAQGGNFVESYVEREYNLAVDDSMFRELKSQFEKRIKKGQAKEELVSLVQSGFSKVKCLGGLIKDSIVTEELENLVGIMKDSEFPGLTEHIRTAETIVALRKGLLKDNFRDIKAVLDEASEVSQSEEYWNVLPEAHKELKMAKCYLRDHEAHQALRRIFEETGSFHQHDNKEIEEQEHAARARRMSISVGHEVTVGRKYSIEVTEDDHIDFDTVNTEEITEALEKAEKLTVQGRSKIVSTLMNTVRIVGEMRKAMKSGDWPTVGGIINNLDEKKIHMLANKEISCIRAILDQRQYQKLLLEGLKKGAPLCAHGFVDSSISSTDLLEVAVTKSEKRGGVGGQLSKEVQWLHRSCKRVIEIRSLINQLEFEKAKSAALEASRAFEEETGHYDTEWKHYVAEELEKYEKELTKKQEFAKVVGEIQRATANCNVDQMKLAILEAKEAKLEECPDLSMRRSIIHAKRILKETSMVEKTLIEEGLKMCNQKKLEACLRRAEELNLSTDVTEHSKEELRKLKELRRRLAKAIRFMKRDEMGRVLAMSRKMEEDVGEAQAGRLQRASYSKMKNFSSVEYLHELPVNIATYLQLELAKENAMGSGGLGDLVDLTVRIKEKIFASRQSQEYYGKLKTFRGLREEEDFARHRMITDFNLASGMLQFSKKEIPTSLLKLPTNLSSLAVRIFRQNVLGWLGIRTFSHPHILLQQIVKVCVKVRGIRDEVYCQIFKQMDGCGDNEIRIKLWVLLKLCLTSFPPSEALENYVEFFLLRNGRTECIEAMHKCVLEWKVKHEKKTRSARHADKDVTLEDVVEAIKFFERVNFERGAFDGEEKLKELTLAQTNSVWAKKFRLLSGGKAILSAEDMRAQLSAGSGSVGDLRAVRFLVCGDLKAARGQSSKEDLSKDVMKEDMLEYIETIHCTVMEKVKGSDSYFSKKSYTWDNVKFDADWFKGAVKFARSQIHRIKNKLCGRGEDFHRIAHRSVRIQLVEEYEKMKKKAIMQDEIDAEEENLPDDEVAMVVSTKKGKKAKKKTAVVARKLSSGATQVIGSTAQITVPNRFKLEDMQRARGPEEASPKAKRAGRKRTSSVDQIEQLSGDEVSDMDFSEEEDEEPRGGGGGRGGNGGGDGGKGEAAGAIGGGRGGRTKRFRASVLGYDMIKLSPAVEHKLMRHQEESEKKEMEEIDGREGKEDSRVTLAAVREEAGSEGEEKEKEVKPLMDKPIRKGGRKKTLSNFMAAINEEEEEQEEEDMLM